MFSCCIDVVLIIITPVSRWIIAFVIRLIHLLCLIYLVKAKVKNMKLFLIHLWHKICNKHVNQCCRYHRFTGNFITCLMRFVRKHEWKDVIILAYKANEKYTLLYGMSCSTIHTEMLLIVIIYNLIGKKLLSSILKCIILCKFVIRKTKDCRYI